MKTFGFYLLICLPVLMSFAQHEGTTKVTLTLRTERTPVYIGDKVTMECSVEGSVTDWSYRFYKVGNGHYDQINQTTEHTYTIKSVSQSDSGEYQCDVYRADGHQVLAPSNRVTLTVHGHRNVTLTLRTERTPVYIGDKVTMECSVEGSVTDWSYRFHKVGSRRDSPIKQITESTYTIESVSQSDSGEYQCDVYSADYRQFLGLSHRVTLTAHELFSNPTLTVHPNTTLWEGDTVTLRCQSERQVQEIRLTYKFYRDKQSVSQRASKSEFTIPSARPEKSGSYWCEVEAEGKKTEKKTSERVQVTMRDHPKATLTLPSQRDVVYIGDTVAMDCRIESSFTGWRYKWYRGNVTYRGSPIKDVTGQTYTIQSVTQSDSGAYWCKADRNDPTHHLQNSNAVTLSVKELFTKPSLTVHPSTTLWQGDSVTLRCQSESLLQGTQLRYKFYRDEEPVSQRASESEFTIPSARPEKSGSYWCEVEEEGKKTEKKTSERVQVTVRVSHLPIILGSVGSSLFLLMLLLFVYHKTRGLPCFESKTARRKDKRMDVNNPGGGAVQMEAINDEGSKPEVFYSELVDVPKTKKKGMPPVNSSPAGVYSEVKFHQGGSTASNCDVLYSEITKEKPNEKQGASPAASFFSFHE